VPNEYWRFVGKGPMSIDTPVGKVYRAVEEIWKRPIKKWSLMGTFPILFTDDFIGCVKINKSLRKSCQPIGQQGDLLVLLANVSPHKSGIFCPLP
jgi:hypothetical protein